MYSTELSGLREMTATCVRGFDPGSLSPVEAMAVVRDATAIVRAVEAVRMLAAARAAEGEQWREDGHASAGDWFAAAAGTTAHVARERIACGRRLRDLNETRVVALAGGLSVEQATVVADAASADREREAELLASAAGDSLSELRDLCLRVKAKADPSPEKTHARLRGQRAVWSWMDKEGAYNLRLRTTIDQGARIESELDRLTDAEFHRARKDGRRESHENYRADALAEMARRSQRADAINATGKKSRAVPVRFLALIRADLSVFERGSAAEGEVCEIAGLGPIPVSVARELLGESILELVLTKGQDANVTHLGRGPNAVQKLMLLWRSPVCAVHGCGKRIRLEGDHIKEFRRTRHTTLRELRHLCDHHHDQKTNHGWELIEGDGKQPMVPPDDPRHPRNLRFPQHTTPAEGAA